MLEVVQLLQEISGSRVSVVFGNKQLGDVDHTFADTKCAELMMGYHPRVTLREGLTHEFEYIHLLQEFAVDIA